MYIRLKLGKHGVIPLVEQEVEAFVLPSIKLAVLVDGKPATKPLLEDAHGHHHIDPMATYVARLTNFRIVFQNRKDPEAAFYVKLSVVDHVVSEKSSWYWKYNNTDLYFQHGTLQPLQITFTEKRDQFTESINKQMATRAWEIKEEPKPQPTPRAEKKVVSLGGVSSIVKMQSEKKIQDDAKLTNAFRDLDALIENAQDMVNLANRLTATLKNTPHSEQEAEYHSKIMQEMGIWSPVTRETHGSGNLYFRELSVQLYNFLEEHLKFNDPSINNLGSNVVILYDLYCIFNRARGTELISPEDLLKGCKMFEELNLPASLREFENGVVAVVARQYDDSTSAYKVRDIIDQQGPKTVAQLAKQFNLFIPVAEHYMIHAEDMGLLCRDISQQGTLFYLNIFH